MDPDEMKSAYWPDATDHGVFVGNAWEFVDHCMVSHMRWKSTSHCVFNHVIELDDNGVEARGESITLVICFKRLKRFGHMARALPNLYEKKASGASLNVSVCMVQV